jgi:hypothetical protein
MPFFGNKRRDFSIQPPRQQVDGTPFFVTDSANIDFTLDNLNLTADLTFTGVVAGTYGDATNIPVLQIDQWGRVTGVTLQPISSSGLALEVNGTPNLSQILLNLVDSATIEVVDLGGGDIEFNYIGTGGTYTANNGITENPANNFQLGGPLTKHTTINGAGYTYDLFFTNLRLFRVNSLGKSWIQNTTFPGVVNSVIIDSQFTSITAEVNSNAYRASVSTDGDSTSGSELVRMQSFITYPGGTIGFGAYKVEPAAAFLQIRTPNVNASIATVGQVLALANVNGEVEFINASTTTGDSISPFLLMGG